MTDHGGAASPPQEVLAAMAAAIHATRWQNVELQDGDSECEEQAAAAYAALRAAQEAPAPEGLRRLSGYVTAPTQRARASAHIEYPDEPPMSPESIGWTGAGETEAEAMANLGRALAATPPTPAEPPRPDEPVHVHVAGAGEGGAICADCGHDFRERCHARLLDETPYRCGGPQTGQPKPHTACNCTPRAEARPPEGLDAAWAAAEAATDQKMLSVEAHLGGGYGAEGWLHYPTKRVRETGPTPIAALLALAARLSAGGATKP